MLVSDFRPQLIDSIAMLAERLYLEEISTSILNKALSANPWFTAYCLELSISFVPTWLDRERVQRFVDRYSLPSQDPRRIGIITTANIPLVGFLDVLICLLSGNIAYVRCSHQDRILMEWVRKIWREELPLLENFFHVIPKLASIDCLIVHGMNTSTRNSIGYSKKSFILSEKTGFL